MPSLGAIVRALELTVIIAYYVANLACLGIAFCFLVDCFRKARALLCDVGGDHTKGEHNG